MRGAHRFIRSLSRFSLLSKRYGLPTLLATLPFAVGVIHCYFFYCSLPAFGQHAPVSIPSTRASLNGKAPVVGLDPQKSLASYRRLKWMQSDNGLPQNSALALRQTRDGAMWIATVGGGENRSENGAFTAITGRDGFWNDNASCILEDDILEDDYGYFWITRIWITRNRGLSKNAAAHRRNSNAPSRNFARFLKLRPLASPLSLSHSPSGSPLTALNMWSIIPAAQTDVIRYSLDQRGAFGPAEQQWTGEDGEKIAVAVYGIRIDDQEFEHSRRDRIWLATEDIAERKQATDALLRYQLNPHLC
jgi:hypothetical protein